MNKVMCSRAFVILITIVAAGCEPPSITITTPKAGAFLSNVAGENSVTVRGTVTGDVSNLAVTVNDQPATFDANGEGGWWTVITIDPAEGPFFRFEAVVTEIDGDLSGVDRVTVVRGPKKAAGATADAAALHIAERTFPFLAHRHNLHVGINQAMADQFQPQEEIYYDSCAKEYCVVPGPFGTCIVDNCHSVRLNLSRNPRVQGAEMTLDSVYPLDNLLVTVRMTDLSMVADADISEAPDCDIEIFADELEVRMSLDIEPDPADASKLRVTQGNAVSVVSGTSGIAHCGSTPWISSWVEGLVEGQLESKLDTNLRNRFSAAFNATDPATGLTRIEEEFAAALDGVSLDELTATAESVLSGTLNAAFTRAFEGLTGEGVTVLAEASLTTSCPNPMRTFDHVYDVFPAIPDFPHAVIKNVSSGIPATTLETDPPVTVFEASYSGGSEDTGTDWTSTVGTFVATTGTTAGTWTATTGGTTTTTGGTTTTTGTTTGTTTTGGTTAPDPGTGTIYEPQPVGYQIALAVSSTMINEVLRVETECGTLDFVFTDPSLTAGFVADTLSSGPFSLYTPTDPDASVRIELEPTVAPFVTGYKHASGMPVDLRVGGLRAKVIDEADPADPADDELILEVELEIQIGVSVSYNGFTGQLQASIAEPKAEDVTLYVNGVGQNVNALAELLLPTLGPGPLAEYVPELASVIGGVDVPSIELLGQNVTPTLLRIDRHGGYLAFFLNTDLEIPEPPTWCDLNPTLCTDGQPDPCLISPESCDDEGNFDPCIEDPALCTGNPCAADPSLCNPNLDP